MGSRSRFNSALTVLTVPHDTLGGEDDHAVEQMSQRNLRMRAVRIGPKVPMMATSRGKPRILLADDHMIVAQAFAKLLEPDFDIVGFVVDGQALLEGAAKLRPDVVILDLNMPLLNGFDAGKKLKEILPDVKLIVLTVTEDVEVAAEALQTWASGFVLKKSAADELVKAIREAIKGKKYVSKHMEQKLRDRFVRDPRANHTKTMTPKQRHVLQLLAEGRTMKEAADILHVAPRTVAFHKYRIMEECGIKTNSDLILLAIREHIISAT
jgi:DNA-binding NarL/FixJ family response regulator